MAFAGEKRSKGLPPLRQPPNRYQYKLFVEKHLRELGLRAGHRIHFHDHNILHVLVPAIHHGAFGLHACGIIAALVALIIAEQLVAHVPNGVVVDARVVEHLGEFRPNFVVPANVFLQHAILHNGFPGIAFHKSASS